MVSTIALWMELFWREGRLYCYFSHSVLIDLWTTLNNVFIWWHVLYMSGILDYLEGFQDTHLHQVVQLFLSFWNSDVCTELRLVPAIRNSFFFSATVFLTSGSFPTGLQGILSYRYGCSRAQGVFKWCFCCRRSTYYSAQAGQVIFFGVFGFSSMKSDLLVQMRKRYTAFCKIWGLHHFEWFSLVNWAIWYCNVILVIESEMRIVESGYCALANSCRATWKVPLLQEYRILFSFISCDTFSHLPLQIFWNIAGEDLAW